MTVRVIDIETTGIEPETDRILEIASVDVAAGGGLANVMQTLVAPGRDIPPEASAVHGLVAEDLEGAPQLETVVAQFGRGDDLYFVAHNCSFEKSFLSAHLGADRWLCTYKCALRVWPDLPSHSNQALRYRFNLPTFGYDRAFFQAHRALPDAVVTAGLFLELTKHAKWADLVQWSGEPALSTVITFGKHRGARYDAVPADYLEWVVNKSDLDADTKFSAKYWLEQRIGHVQPAAAGVANL